MSYKWRQFSIIHHRTDFSFQQHISLVSNILIYKEAFDGRQILGYCAIVYLNHASPFSIVSLKTLIPMQSE